MDANNFFQTILGERNWTWALAGLAYLFAFLIVRHFFMRSLIKRAKGLQSKWLKEIKILYSKQCYGGWILFMVSFFLFVFVWETGNFNSPSLYEIGIDSIIVLTLLLAIISHIIAFGFSTIQILKRLENNQMTL